MLELCAAGEVRCSEKTGRPSAATIRTVDQPPAEVIRTLWQRWLTHAVIDEFSRVEEIKGQRVRNVLSAVQPRRQTVAEALAECPPDEWIGVDALFTTMRRETLIARCLSVGVSVQQDIP